MVCYLCLWLFLSLTKKPFESMLNQKANEKRMKDNDELIGLLVHSYNNYLAGMMGYSELALLDFEHEPEPASEQQVALSKNNEQTKDFIQRSLISGKEAVHFSQTLLASIGRLQLAMEPCSLFEVLDLPEFSEDISNWSQNPLINIQIKSNMTWLSECINDLILFAQFIAKSNVIGLTVKVNNVSQIVDIEIGGSAAKLSDRQQMNLFEPYYSSRTLMGTKDIGLAKAKGFLSQMKARLNWENGKGFVIEMPFLKKQ